jgi:hypothetical protein
MPQNFIAVDRDQVFLMPPSLCDWVADDHLVWTILGSVEDMDLAAFYLAYRPDGHGRPAYDPSAAGVVVVRVFAGEPRLDNAMADPSGRSGNCNLLVRRHVLVSLSHALSSSVTGLTPSDPRM